MIIRLNDNNNNIFKKDIFFRKDGFTIAENTNKLYFTTLFKDDIFISDNPDELSLNTKREIDPEGLFLLGLTGSCFHLTSPFKKIFALRPTTEVKKAGSRLVFRLKRSGSTTNTLNLDKAVPILESTLLFNLSKPAIFNIESPEYIYFSEKTQNISRVKIREISEINRDYFYRLPLFPFFTTSYLELFSKDVPEPHNLIWLEGAYEYFHSFNWKRTTERLDTEIHILERSFIPFRILKKIFPSRIIRDGLSRIRNHVDISTHRKIIDQIHFQRVLPLNNLFAEKESPEMPFAGSNIKTVFKSLSRSLINNNKVDYYILRYMISKENRLRNTLMNNKRFHENLLKDQRNKLTALLEDIFKDLFNDNIEHYDMNNIEIFRTLLFLFYLQRSSIHIPVKS